MTDHTVVVPADLHGERADRIVAACLEVARSASRAAFDAGAVLVQGDVIKPSQRLESGAVIAVSLDDGPPSLEPDPSVPITVIFEDPHVLVLDKPVDLVVHPTSPRSIGTLVHGLISAYPEIEGVGDAGRWGIVHRLDRDTSGALIVARTARAHSELTRMIRDREVTRRYVALARGAFDAARGTIEAPIGRDQRNPMRMRLDRSGRPAVTHYRRSASWDEPEVTLLDVGLETGRTHQIRVHLSAIDHPIIGDPAYGVTGGPADPGRPWLHARSVAFAHPVTGEQISASAPLPPDLADSLASIGPPVRGSIDEAKGAV